MEEDLRLRRKAELILGGGVRLPEGFRMPCRISRSTAGPGAGSGSAAFGFDGCRVKKSVSYDDGEFELVVSDGGYAMTRRGEPFLESVEIIPVVYHCPGQAFFNLDQRCIFKCAFCASPRLGHDATKGLTDDIIVDMVRKAEEVQDVPAIALTSGVVGSVEETVARFESCVRRLRSEFPDKTIGIEPYVETEDQIRRLKDAGADEIKINIETARDDTFAKVCPELDRAGIRECLRYAVSIFGRGKVASNVIYGLGETDGDIEEIVSSLADDGVVAGLRPLKHNPFNGGSLAGMLGAIEPNTAERAIRLAAMHRRILA
jgi:hypothetical protein